MKMIMVTYNAALEEDLEAVMKECGIQYYTKLPRVVGVGEKTGPRLDTHVWPGANSVLMISLDDGSARNLMERLGKLRHAMDGGVRAFQLNVEEEV